MSERLNRKALRRAFRNRDSEPKRSPESNEIPNTSFNEVPNTSDNEHPSDYEMVRWTREVATYTKWLVIVGAVAAVIALLNLGAIRDQLNEMRAEKRPWISVDVVPTDKIDGNGGTLPVHIIMKNTGDAAATDLETMRTQIYPDIPGSDAMRHHIPFYDCVAGVTGAGLGTALFPQETFEKPDLALTQGDVKPGEFSDRKIFQGALMVCLSYGIAGRTEAAHVTGKLYLIEKSPKAPGISLLAVNTYAN